MILKLTVLGVIAFASSAFAGDEISKRIVPTKAFYVDQTRGMATPYGPGKESETTFGKIDFDKSDKYLMLNIGADILFGDSSNYTIFDNKFYPDDQKITPNPTRKPWWDLQKRSSHYRKVSQVSRTCLETVVESNQEFEVTTPYERLCDIKMENDDKRAIIRGYTCFLDLDYRRTFKIDQRIRQECKDSKFLKQIGILPQEITGGITYSIADDDSGSGNYKILGRTKTHITFNPGKDIEVYDDYRSNTPNWPSTVVVDNNFAGLTINKQHNKFVVAPKVLADNQCGDFTLDTSICDYIQPLGLEIRLYELKPNGKKSLRNVWYDGSILPPQWRGVVPLKGYPVYMEEGKSYELVGDSKYPDMFYRLGKEDSSQFLIPTIGITELNNPDLDVFPTLETLKFDRKMDKTPTIPGFTRDRRALRGDFSTFDAAIQALEELVMGSGNWPPYLSKVCSASGDCRKPRNATHKIYAKFELAKKTLTGKRKNRKDNYYAKDLVMRRSTDLAPQTDATFEEIKFVRKPVKD